MVSLWDRNKKITIKEAVENFNITIDVIRHWRNKYAVQMVLPLPDMTAEEKQKMELLQKQNVNSYLIKIIQINN